jgi:PAS domain S-box-containing protein
MLDATSASLAKDVHEADENLRGGVWWIVGGAGALVVLIMAGWALGLRRRVRQRTEESVLRTSEQRFRALVHKAAEVIIVTDPQGEATYVSPSAEQVTGYPADRLLGRGLAELVGPRQRGALDRAFATVLPRPGAETELQLRLRHADGGWRWIEMIMRNLTDVPAVSGLVLNFAHPGPRRAGAGPGPAGAGSGRSPVHRPGRVQGRQRQLRARDGRPAAAGGHGSTVRLAARLGHPRPPRR